MICAYTYHKDLSKLIDCLHAKHEPRKLSRSVVRHYDKTSRAHVYVTAAFLASFLCSVFMILWQTDGTDCTDGLLPLCNELLCRVARFDTAYFTRCHLLKELLDDLNDSVSDLPEIIKITQKSGRTLDSISKDCKDEMLAHDLLEALAQRTPNLNVLTTVYEKMAQMDDRSMTLLLFWEFYRFAGHFVEYP